MSRNWKNRYRALRQLDIPILKHLRRAPSQFVLSRDLDSPGIYMLSALFRYPSPGQGHLRIVSEDGIELGAMPIAHWHRFAQCMLQLTRAQRITIEFVTENIDALPRLFALGMPRIAEPPSADLLSISEKSICAAIATYPGRYSLLEKTIHSLIDQVDHIFIYLNNYRLVPDYVVRFGETGKVHYILDTGSRLRAAGKFWWLRQHTCYWLTCDDDIIYPPDYASRMGSCLAAYGDKAVIGVHGTIFSENFVHCYASRIAELKFEAPLPKNTPVHMLGSGTACFHSSILREEGMERLLRYPTANDEILAVICRESGIPQISVARQEQWVRSNPDMRYGLYEETMFSAAKQAEIVDLLSAGNPWPRIDPDRVKSEGRGGAS